MPFKWTITYADDDQGQWHIYALHFRQVILRKIPVTHLLTAMEVFTTWQVKCRKFSVPVKTTSMGWNCKRKVLWWFRRKHTSLALYALWAANWWLFRAENQQCGNGFNAILSSCSWGFKCVGCAPNLGDTWGRLCQQYAYVISTHRILWCMITYAWPQIPIFGTNVHMRMSHITYSSGKWCYFSLEKGGSLVVVASCSKCCHCSPRKA